MPQKYGKSSLYGKLLIYQKRQFKERHKVKLLTASLHIQYVVSCDEVDFHLIGELDGCPSNHNVYAGSQEAGPITYCRRSIHLCIHKHWRRLVTLGRQLNTSQTRSPITALHVKSNSPHYLCQKVIQPKQPCKSLVPKEYLLK